MKLFSYRHLVVCTCLYGDCIRAFKKYIYENKNCVKRNNVEAKDRQTSASGSNNIVGCPAHQSFIDQICDLKSELTVQPRKLSINIS